MLWHQLRQTQTGARTQEAVIVVDEAKHAVIDPLMIGHMRVGRVNANGFADDLRQGPLGPDEAVKDVAGADLIAVENAFFKFGVYRLGIRRCHSRLHGMTPRCGVAASVWTSVASHNARLLRA